MPHEPDETPEEYQEPPIPPESEEAAEAEPEENEAEPVEYEPAPEEEGEAPVAEEEAATPSPAGEPLLQPCTNCATLLDVADLEPFAKVHCPICGTAIRARTQLKNFTLVEVLGAGGMGAVYKALDTNLNRMVALKVVRKEFSADAEYVAKFEREARITASVNHPHVVKVYSFGSDHGLFYIAMELVDKGSLDDLMSLQGRVAEIQALTVGIQVAQGLQAAHQKGLIHRDVKPGNILFADAQTAKIVDFGLALLAEHEAEERGEVWGTPYYVAPEKLDHAPEDFRSDMYSLGGTLFHAIAGRPPFEADTASMVALKHLKSKAVSLQAFAPDVSSATAYVINRTLNKDPEQRYQSYAELVEHLEYAKSQLTAAGTGPRKPKERVVVESASQQKAAGIITLIMILLVAAGGFAAYHYWDRIVPSHPANASGVAQDPEAASKALHDQFDTARKQIVAGDYAAAQDTLKKLDDSDLISQPLQNWVTLSHGFVSLLQDSEGDSRDWFKVVAERGHFSNDPSDAALVKFFTAVSAVMSNASPVSPREGSMFAPDSFEAMGPLLYAFKDWSRSNFEYSGKLLAIYLATQPKAPFEWVGEFKPLAQKFADDEAAYEKAASAANSAKTPDERADALKQVQDLEGRAKGKLAAKLAKMEADLKKKSADLDANYNQHLVEESQHDDQALATAKQKYAAAITVFHFDEARAALNAAIVTGTAAVQARTVLLKKADWLHQFKAQLIQDINAYGYTDHIVNKSGAALPDGPKTANDASLLIQTQFGVIPCAWENLPASALLAIANKYIQSMSVTAPQQAADRQWLCGVFACEEGLPRDGHTMLVQASQMKDEYKNELSLFLESE